jgi:diaminohydroxyphosphoribosylaminopyrimidine deaminase/5-amino-6-(5-phosphoribosylamino)uracil reductase
MIFHREYMQRCIELAYKGIGTVAPNPMVGCVIVHNEKIIGEGWHERFGGPHAEVNAIHAVKDKALLRFSTLYVNLEPCSHFGKTPPCADLIIESGIPAVVIGCTDSFSLVNGKGIEKMRLAGIDVKTEVLEEASRELNKRFFTFHEKKRPYLILKWAESGDGYIDKERSIEQTGEQIQISSAASKVRLHRWRAEEQAILIGTTTAILDNPRLTVREAEGRNPLRLVLDQSNRIPESHHLKDGSVPTLIFTAHPGKEKENLEFVNISFDSSSSIQSEIMQVLYKRNIQSVLIEGGARLLNSFFETGLWDEARVFISTNKLGSGVKAPLKPKMTYSDERIGPDQLRIYRNAEDIRQSTK